MEATHPLRQRAIRLEYLTIAWNVIEATVAVSVGIVAGSIALVGFGFDSSIEAFAASVVLWQFRSGADEQRERRALRIIAVTFFVLAAYVTVESIRNLFFAHDPPHRAQPDSARNNMQSIPAPDA